MPCKIGFYKSCTNGHAAQLPTSKLRLYSNDMSRWIQTKSGKGTSFEVNEEYKIFAGNKKSLTPMQQLKERDISRPLSLSVEKILFYISGLVILALALMPVICAVVLTGPVSIPLVIALTIGLSVFCVLVSHAVFMKGIDCKNKLEKLDAISDLVNNIEKQHSNKGCYDEEQLFDLLKKMIDAESFGIERLQYQKSLNSLNAMLEGDSGLKSEIIDLVAQGDTDTLKRKIDDFLALNTEDKAKSILCELLDNDAFFCEFLKNPKNEEAYFDGVVKVLEFYFESRHMYVVDDDDFHYAVKALIQKMIQIANEFEYNQNTINTLNDVSMKIDKYIFHKQDTLTNRRDRGTYRERHLQYGKSSSLFH